MFSKISKTQVVNIKNKYELKIFLKKNLFKDEMIICMGAGSISNWIRNISKESVSYTHLTLPTILLV